MATQKIIFIFFILLGIFCGIAAAQDANIDSNTIAISDSNSILDQNQLSLPAVESCGDGICTGDEGILSCPADCDICGDGICSINETLASCPEDCSVCGDRFCSGNETSESCQTDCTAVQNNTFSIDPGAIERGIKTAQRNLIVVILIGMACLGIIFGMFLMAKYSHKREQKRKNIEEIKKMNVEEDERNVEVNENEINRSELENEQNKP